MKMADGYISDVKPGAENLGSRELWFGAQSSPSTELALFEFTVIDASRKMLCNSWNWRMLDFGYWLYCGVKTLKHQPPSLKWTISAPKKQGTLKLVILMGWAT